MRNRYLGTEDAATADVVTRESAMTNLQKGTHSSNGEVLSYSLYDTYTLLNTVNTYTFFQVPRGQGTPVKNLADTNQLLAGTMPQAQRMICDRIKLQILGLSGSTNAEIQEVMEMLFNTTAEILIPGKENLGIFCLSELAGINNLISLAATYNGILAANLPSFKLSVPIILAANTSFGVRIIHHEALSAYIDDVRLKWIFSGSLERLS